VNKAIGIPLCVYQFLYNPLVILSRVSGRMLRGTFDGRQASTITWEGGWVPEHYNSVSIRLCAYCRRAALRVSLTSASGVGFFIFDFSGAS